MRKIARKKQTSVKIERWKNKKVWVLRDSKGKIRARKKFSRKDSARKLAIQFKKQKTLKENATRWGRNTYMYNVDVKTLKTRRIFQRTGWQYWVKVKLFKNIKAASSSKTNDKPNTATIEAKRMEAIQNAVGQIEGAEQLYTEDELIKTYENSGRLKILAERIIYFDKI